MPTPSVATTSMKVLPSLTADDLTALGIMSIGHRRK
ncbi:hypothetical protein [Mesorhizobium sp. M0488]